MCSALPRAAPTLPTGLKPANRVRGPRETMNPRESSEEQAVLCNMFNTIGDRIAEYRNTTRQGSLCSLPWGLNPQTSHKGSLFDPPTDRRLTPCGMLAYAMPRTCLRHAAHLQMPCGTPAYAMRYTCLCHAVHLRHCRCGVHRENKISFLRRKRRHYRDILSCLHLHKLCSAPPTRI